MTLRRPQTLRVRLVLAAAGSILAALALFGVATVVVVRHELRGSLDSALRQRAEQVARAGRLGPGRADVAGGAREPGVGPPDRGRGDRRPWPDPGPVADARARGCCPEDRLARAARVSGATGFENIDLDGRPFRLFAAPIALSGPAGGGAVLVASDTTDIARTTTTSACRGR